jgi:predicted DNA-binding transcriptional regulator AlpA
MTDYLDIYDLAEVLGKTPETIRRNLKNRPMTVPPTLHIPGTRMLRWRRADVEGWICEQGPWLKRRGAP